MTKLRKSRTAIAVVLALTLLAGLVLAVRAVDHMDRTEVVGYFDNSTALFPGDDVRILGVPVGRVTKVQPQPDGVKVSFWFDRQYKVPADAKAAILSPMLVTGRAIQLTPAYTGGPTLKDGAVIPRDRTAVPVEWDEVRVQLKRLTQLLAPTQPGGVSTLGSFINTTADNLRGQGGAIRDTIIKLSQAMSVLGDHSGDIFSTLKNLSILVTALRGSSDLLGQLNNNLASVSGVLASDPGKIGDAFVDMNSVIGDVKDFVNENGETIGTTADKLASISTALNESLDDIKQTLHIAPSTVQNFNNIYEASNGAFTGALAVNNFANPISFLCGAIQAASRLNAEQSSKLCVQYLAPIIKNRQFNFPPIGEDFFVGAQARPNEVTYSEDWMRPDFLPPATSPAPASGPAPAGAADQGAPLAAETTPVVQTDPNAGLTGMMAPAAGGGS
jgi:phospholipid/cholesterol/gamma-HCH transport system substrate-binding protein